MPRSWGDRWLALSETESSVSRSSFDLEQEMELERQESWQQNTTWSSGHFPNRFTGALIQSVPLDEDSSLLSLSLTDNDWLSILCSTYFNEVCAGTIGYQRFAAFREGLTVGPWRNGLLLGSLQLEQEHAVPDADLLSAFRLDWSVRSREKDQLIENLMSKMRAFPMLNRLYDFLSERGLFGFDRDRFFSQFHRAWFFDYHPSARAMHEWSSGFHHVFIGDRKRGRVKGLHHWGRFHYLEVRGLLTTDEILRLCPNNTTSLQFRYEDALKPVGTLLIGYDFRFELSLFFLAFLLSPNNQFQLFINNNLLSITTYDVAYTEGALATAFAEC